MSAVAIQERPLAPAVYVGWQDGVPATATLPAIPGFALYNLTAAVGEHPADSTVSRGTLERLGFQVPPPPFHDR